MPHNPELLLTGSKEEIYWSFYCPLPRSETFCCMVCIASLQLPRMLYYCSHPAGSHCVAAEEVSDLCSSGCGAPGRVGRPGRRDHSRAQGAVSRAGALKSVPFENRVGGCMIYDAHCQNTQGYSLQPYATAPGACKMALTTCCLGYFEMKTDQRRGLCGLSG